MTVAPEHIVEALAAIRRAARGDAYPHAFPDRTRVAALVEAVSHALYPVRLGGWRGDPAAEDGFVADRLVEALAIVEEQADVELAYWQDEAADDFDPELPTQIAALFAEELPDIRRLLDADLAAALIGDPAARSIDEVLICYPGAAAILHHRIANALYRLGAPIVARVVSELANARTGIDIHPGATIGGSFFIDHGTGVVIGETAIVGERVRLYQHVTLGARAPLGLSADGPRQRLARHPIVEDDVTIYAGTTILGRVTIGRGSVIGGNVWLLDDVAAGSVVAQPTASVLPLGEADDLNDRLHGR